MISCGPLQKNDGVLKYPPGNNYLDGVTVTFTCQPDYFLHGDQQRTCINGTWSPGWWAWCRCELIFFITHFDNEEENKEIFCVLKGGMKSTLLSGSLESSFLFLLSPYSLRYSAGAGV